ncbi:hypothetical protein MHHB_P0507 [Methanofervidicoccus abyssi]|uniref:S-layer protein outer domain-containing protein n=2 Tax=Methanofervidicoccus abyssi TaxID=2082189 RepID=A0A401HPS6_9EURY|nr:hypothetical protein MHHB_P0507 [Methanofervidicoccus abyssi]
MSLVGICYGENITVELLPSNIEANIGDTFNLSLIVKNVPEIVKSRINIFNPNVPEEDGKCAGVDIYICYDSNILSLSNIQLSNIGESADLKMVNLSSGFISLAWLFNPVYGNFTIATISFKGLNPGETNITLKNVVISTEDGYEYKNVSTYPATVVIKPYTTTITVTVPTPNLVIGTTTPPQLPAQYYGKVISPTPLSGYIVAKIGNESYGSIPLVNNTFGGPTYLDEKLLVYAPGQDGAEVTFYLNGSILLNSSDTIYYKAGDIRNVTLYYNAENIRNVTSSSSTSSGSESTSSTSSGSESISSTSSGSSISSSGGGGSPVFKNPYPDVAPDIKSIKIKEIVHKAKLIVGSNIDVNLSAKDLKTTFVLTNKPLDIEEDCILIGGPVANPIVKKYLEIFPVKVTNEYPGKHRGVIEVTKINGHTVVLLAGSDRWGTKAAVEYFKTLEDIPDRPIFVEWRDGKVVKINRP